MPFWSRGSSDDGPTSRDFSSSDEADYTTSEITPSFGGGGGGGGGGGAAELQQFAAAMQQQMVVQATINSITQKAFEKCITSKPSESLSGSEAACVQATTMKWLDTNQFMFMRFQKKMGAGQAQQFN
mmetsp:Transcript_15138/g.18440  ORF Transcript_15138/g.18440 Transcript_15138/m.18440 type:complete len:127 (+) Transcript_15138:127-507(+)